MPHDLFAAPFDNVWLIKKPPDVEWSIKTVYDFILPAIVFLNFTPLLVDFPILLILELKRLTDHLIRHIPITKHADPAFESFLVEVDDEMIAGGDDADTMDGKDLRHRDELMILLLGGFVVRHKETFLRCKAEEQETGQKPVVTAPRRLNATTPDGATAQKERARTKVQDEARRREAAKRATNAEARRKREVARVEDEITDKEDELASVTAEINSPDFYDSHANPHEVFSRYAQLKKEVDALYAKLERLESTHAQATGH